MDKPKNKKSVKKIISDVTFGIFMAFFGLLFVFSILDKTVGISVGGYHVLWVKSPSMEPTIPTSSYILVKDVDSKDVNVGDVITFISDDPAIKGQFNTHRVEGITPEGQFTTKGDYNPGPDAYWVKPENVKYIYEKNLPFLSFFGRLFVTPYGLVVTLVTIGGLVALWFVIDSKDRKKELINEMVQEEVKRLEEEARLKNLKK